MGFELVTFELQRAALTNLAFQLVIPVCNTVKCIVLQIELLVVAVEALLHTLTNAD